LEIPPFLFRKECFLLNIGQKANFFAKIAKHNDPYILKMVAYSNIKIDLVAKIKAKS